MKQIVALAFTQKVYAPYQSKACSRNQIHSFLSPAINLFQSSLVISLSRTSRSHRKLIVGFYRSGGCCEEILVPVKIASKDRERKKKKAISLFPTLRIGGRIYVHPQLAFNPNRQIQAFYTGSHQRKNGQAFMSLLPLVGIVELSLEK